MVSTAVKAAEIYARYNIPTIPIGDDKRPLVGNFKLATFSMRQSRAFMRRHPTAAAIGVPDGPLSGIVRLDIDEHGSDVLRKVIRLAGEPGAIARTASEKFHLWYADNGERRLTGAIGHRNARPWDDLKVDLCGNGGYAISPPSRFTNGGEYSFVGDVQLDDLLRSRHRMPKIQGLPDRAYLAPARSSTALSFDTASGMRDGRGRNNHLFNTLCRVAGNFNKTIESLLDFAREQNAMFGEPLSDDEVIRTAKSVFKYYLAGNLRTGSHGAWFRKHDAQLLARDPHFFALIGWLKAENGPTSEFIVADGLVGPKHLPWSREKFQRARRRAIDEGWIVQIRKPARGRAALYRWGSACATNQD